MGTPLTCAGQVTLKAGKTVKSPVPWTVPSGSLIVWFNRIEMEKLVRSVAVIQHRDVGHAIIVEIPNRQTCGCNTDRVVYRRNRPEGTGAVVEVNAYAVGARSASDQHGDVIGAVPIEVCRSTERGDGPVATLGCD